MLLVGAIMKMFQNRLLLLFCVSMPDIIGVESKPEQKRLLFNDLSVVMRAEMDLYHIFEKTMIYPPEDDLKITNNVIDWLGDDFPEFVPTGDEMNDILTQCNLIMTKLAEKFDGIEKAIGLDSVIIGVNMRDDIRVTIKEMKNQFNRALDCSGNLTLFNRAEWQIVMNKIDASDSRKKKIALQFDDASNPCAGFEPGDVENVLLKLYNSILAENGGNLEQSALEYSNHRVQMRENTSCGNMQSPNQYLYNLYENVMVTELMGLVASAFGYYLHFRRNSVDLHRELQKAHEDRQERLSTYFEVFKNSIGKASLSSPSCDLVDLKEYADHDEHQKDCSDESRGCDEILSSFSLLPSRSNIRENMVVIGVRVSKKESITCIEIKQGKLLPGGRIEKDSEEWMACDVLKSLYKDSRLLRRQHEGKLTKARVDYILIDEDHHNIDLDNVVGQIGQIVTGVSFALSNACPEGQHIQLRLEYSKFNFTSGEVDPHRTSQSSSTCHTDRIDITEAESISNQGRVADRNMRHSISNSFMTLGRSHIKINAGNTIEPLLDDQSVEMTPAAPLCGIGLYHKAATGYLAFTIYSVNFSGYMEKGKNFDQDVMNEQAEVWTNDNGTYYVRRVYFIPTGLIIGLIYACCKYCCRSSEESVETPQ